MSRRLEPQYASEALQGVIANRGQGSDAGAVFAFGTTIPTDGTSGYAPGCNFVYLVAGSTFFYVNYGSNTSCRFAAQIGSDLSNLTATATEVNRIADLTNRTYAMPGNITLNETLSDKLLAMNGPINGNVTLPPANGSGIQFNIFITSNLSAGNLSFNTSGGSTFAGTAYTATDNANAAVNSFSHQNASVITLNGSTRGGIRGDKLEFKDVGPNTWQVTLFLTATGTEATPFS